MENIISVWVNLSAEILQINNKDFQCFGLGEMHSSVTKLDNCSCGLSFWFFGSHALSGEV